MIKNICFVVAFSLSFASYAYAGDCQVKGHREGNKFYGNTTCADTSMSDIVVKGKLTATKVKVDNSFAVTGATYASDVVIEGATLIKGEASLKNVTTKSSVTIYGFLHAFDSRFLSKITLHANNAVFNNSTGTDIDVKKNSRTQQFLCLINNSKISGTVTFGSGKGLVYLAGGSTVGKIVGGKSTATSCPAGVLSKLESKVRLRRAYKEPAL